MSNCVGVHDGAGSSVPGRLDVGSSSAFHKGAPVHLLRANKDLEIRSLM